jgi:hypothetical protein
MKITKEVKAYAVKLFDEKERKVRDLFFKPYTDKEKEVRAKCDALLAESAATLASLKKEYEGEFYISFSCYSEGLRACVSLCRRDDMPKPPAFDKVKFLAELSTSGDLEELESLVDKFFK